MIADLILKVAAMTNEKEHDFYPRPSSAGPERCIRQMVYHGLNTPRTPLPGRAVMIFSDSSFHEILTADWIRQTAFQLHSEQMRVKCRPPMTDGGIDGIITDVLGVDRLWEHKAINHFTHQRYWGGELPLDNLAQCAIYIDAIQQELNPELMEGILLLKNKNTAQYMEFLVEYDQNVDCLTVINSVYSTGETKKINHPIHDIVQSACDKFNRVLDYIDKAILPKRQYDIDHWRCDYCGYNGNCWKGYVYEFEELKTDTELPNEIADTVRYRQETAAHILEMKKENDVISKKIKDILKDAGAREGRAGEYICKLKLMETNKIDKALLTPAELEKATKKGFSERLYISKVKEGKNGL